MLVERMHRNARAVGLACSGDYAPALRDRVDLAFVAGARAKWRTIVKVCAAIPFPIPRRSLDRFRVFVGLGQQLVAHSGIPPLFGVHCKLAEGGNDEPSEPDTLSFPLDSDAIHSIVPVPAPYQGKPVHSLGARSSQSANAVLVDAPDIRRHLRQIVDLMLVGIELSHREVRYFYIEDPAVARDVHVMIDHVR